MKYIGYLTVYVAIQGLVWKPVQAQVPIHTRLTQAQAVQAAEGFCRSVGLPVRTPVAATYPAMELVPELPLFWQPRWQVVFPNQVKVQVVDATGLVCGLNSFALCGVGIANTPAGVAIPKAEAIEKATALMRACGQMSELGVPVAYEEQPSEPPSWKGHQWMVTFPRVYGGIPYKDQYANVLLQAETGEPIGFAIRFTSPSLDPVPIRIEQARAITFASSLIGNSLAAGAALHKAEMKIVQPNTFWQPDGSEEQKVGGVRLAHVVSFKSGTDTVEVWLDAETGDIIGGAYIGVLSGVSSHAAPAKPQLPIKAALRAAQEVRIYRKNQDGGWHLAPVQIISRRTQAKVFKAWEAAKSEPAFTAPSDSEGDKVVLVDGIGRRSDYIATGGHIGSREQWMRMPAELQRLLSKT